MIHFLLCFPLAYPAATAASRIQNIYVVSLVRYNIPEIACVKIIYVWFSRPWERVWKKTKTKWIKSENKTENRQQQHYFGVFISTKFNSSYTQTLIREIRAGRKKKAHELKQIEEKKDLFPSFNDERRQEHHNKTSITKSTLFKSNTAKVVTTIDRPKEWERYMIEFYVCQHQKSTNPKEQERRKKKLRKY